MPKSNLTIHKELMKEAYNNSPLGKTEAQLKRIMVDLATRKVVLPKELVDKINNLRGAFEKQQMEYVERTNKEHREAVDNMLLEAMTTELSLLQEFNQSTTISNNE